MERVAVVLSGAAARGAFQAGALQTLIPALENQGLRPSVYLGTSAGAINAALWGAHADLGSEACGAAVSDIWRHMSRRDVIAHPISTLALSDAPRFTASALGLIDGFPALLDTSPLARTAERVLDTARLAENVAAGIVDGVGVAATRIPPPSDLPKDEAPANARTSVFLDAPTLPVDAVADPDRAVDVAPGPVQRAHVLASAAIPLGFPPQWVQTPEAARGWYVDGGIRLNTPLRPAIALGADRILVVAAMSTEYGGPLPPSQPGERIPDFATTAAQVMHTALADRMTEDLRELRSRNRMVAQAAKGNTTLSRSDGTDLRQIPLMTVSPEPGTLGVLAAEVMDAKLDRPFGALRDTDAFALDRLLRGLGEGAGRRELLSYIFFDSDYFAAQLDRGKRAAEAALRAGWQS